MFNNQTILITGGTGSFGRHFVDVVLRQWQPRRLIVFSRDEQKQHEMRQMHPEGAGSPIRYFLGDVRDRQRLHRAFHDVDIVIHAAALKQVPACEYNPFEAVQTNILGAQNVIDVALDQGVRQVLALSTDKAVNPVNLYGATKLCAEKLFVQGNAYAGGSGTRFSCARYGNVVGSRGSVLRLFLDQRRNGVVSLTDERMTRFWITLDQGVAFVLRCLTVMHGGEIFVPKIPSIRITDLVKAAVPECRVERIGIRPGEKLHEVLVSEDEARLTVEYDGMFVIQPAHRWWQSEPHKDARPVVDGYRYASDTNTEWLDVEALKRLIAALESGERFPTAGEAGSMST